MKKLFPLAFWVLIFLSSPFLLSMESRPEKGKCPHYPYWYSHLESHISRQHTQHPEKAQCHYCEKWYSQQKLQAHIRYMHDSTTEPCPKCKKYLTLRQWQKHLHTEKGKCKWPDSSNLPNTSSWSAVQDPDQNTNSSDDDPPGKLPRRMLKQTTPHASADPLKQQTNPSSQLLELLSSEKTDNQQEEYPPGILTQITSNSDDGSQALFHLGLLENDNDLPWLEN